MKKYERIYREILIGILNKKKNFTQLELSKNCEVSIGLVNQTIKRLKEIGAVEVFSMRFRVLDASKMLFDWAAKRNFSGDINEKYCVNMDFLEMEKSLPFILTAYSGWRFTNKNIPIEYNKVYSYVPDDKKELLRIWLKDKQLIKGRENLFIIFTDDNHLIKNSKNKIAPIPQLFVDLYGLNDMQSKYFIKDILDKYPIFGMGIE